MPITQEKPPDQPVLGSMSVSAVAHAEDVRELDVPVEEAVLAGEVGDQALGGGQVQGAVVGGEVLQHGVGDRDGRGCTSVLGWTNAAHQASARSFWMRRSEDAASCLGLALLVDVEVFQALGESVGDRVGALGEEALVTGMPDWEKRSCWP